MSDSSGNDFLSRVKKWLRDNVGKTILIAGISWFLIGGFILELLPNEYKFMSLIRIATLFPVWFIFSFVICCPILALITLIRIQLVKILPKYLIDIAVIALFAKGIYFFIEERELFIKTAPAFCLIYYIFAILWEKWDENQPQNQTQETHTIQTEKSATVNQNAALPETAANRPAVETKPVPAPVIIQITPAEVAQQELDAFWNSPKSAAEIGRLYERYIGYLNEMNGFNVEYFGIEKGNQDLGRDLICRKQNHTVIIQCKNWSQASTIYAQPIYQLYGTTAHYAKLHPDETVECAFLTTTRRFENNALSAARALGVTLKSLPMPSRFPIIKCKIHREFNGEKRHYYLPGQGLYDSIRLDLNNGDCFCQTVAEAEQAGFTWIKAKYKFSNNNNISAEKAAYEAKMPQPYTAKELAADGKKLAAQRLGLEADEDVDMYEPEDYAAMQQAVKELNAQREAQIAAAKNMMQAKINYQNAVNTSNIYTPKELAADAKKLAAQRLGLDSDEDIDMYEPEHYDAMRQAVKELYEQRQKQIKTSQNMR